MSTIELICKQCGQKLRIPAGLGDLSLTCPKCRHTWDESQPKKPANALATSLFFEDNDSFYTLLSAMEKSGEHFTIETPFTNYRELPDRLKRIFSVEDSKNGQWVDSKTGKFVAGATSTGQYNRSAIVIGGMTATGASIGAGGGAIFGGIGAAPGAFAGAIVGMIAGAVTVALADRKHNLLIEVDAITGRLRFEFRPTSEPPSERT
ncbi:MAG: hypothetical protein C0467_17190 [Planctomycetaceae bacterium]|nr:hypothetical protein [Planctomycetaceae bacterium]